MAWDMAGAFVEEKNTRDSATHIYAPRLLLITPDEWLVDAIIIFRSFNIFAIFRDRMWRFLAGGQRGFCGC